MLLFNKRVMTLPRCTQANHDQQVSPNFVMAPAPPLLSLYDSRVFCRRWNAQDLTSLSKNNETFVEARPRHLTTTPLLYPITSGSAYSTLWKAPRWPHVCAGNNRATEGNPRCVKVVVTTRWCSCVRIDRCLQACGVVPHGLSSHRIILPYTTVPLLSLEKQPNLSKQSTKKQTSLLSWLPMSSLLRLPSKLPAAPRRRPRTEGTERRKR